MFICRPKNMFMSTKKPIFAITFAAWLCVAHPNQCFDEDSFWTRTRPRRADLALTILVREGGKERAPNAVELPANVKF